MATSRISGHALWWDSQWRAVTGCDGESIRERKENCAGIYFGKRLRDAMGEIMASGVTPCRINKWRAGID